MTQSPPSRLRLPCTAVFFVSACVISLLVTPKIAHSECLDGNCVDGKGIFKVDDGVTYVGEFLAGKMHGKGMMYYPNDVGSTVGEFRDGQLNGQGIDSFPDGSTFQGNFNNGKYSGYGVYHHSDGAVYEGEFSEGDYHGKGSYTFPNGRVKSGYWRHGVFIGQEPAKEEPEQEELLPGGMSIEPAEKEQVAPIDDSSATTGDIDASTGGLKEPK